MCGRLMLLCSSLIENPGFFFPPPKIGEGSDDLFFDVKIPPSLHVWNVESPTRNSSSHAQLFGEELGRSE
ncbi:hypothetical protein ACHAW5_001354 [Stephanodiscus triporus]|uniref:Uncharacterized protein n=1 Tax=Stephanodiscus triporus TaxID=2934178 RepID=A0ABD3MSM2_9STRA